VLTALVVDPSLASRRRIGTLLRLGGWQVLEATTSRQAQRAAAGRDLDLVVTEVALRGETGLALLARLRVAGSRARFLVVTAEPTERVRSAAASVGAMACLAKPIDPRTVIGFLAQRVQAPAPRARHLRVVRDVEDVTDADADVDVDAATLDRLQEMFLSALPHRLALIAEGARSGDAIAVAGAAQTLAGAGAQLGHPRITAVCQEIAADARRGVVAQSRLMDLQLLCLRAVQDNWPAAAAGR
jgi:DNA-binding response OmpR family regulator